jgi:hypothetical protein
MRLILLETYLDAFENDEKYKSYLQSEYDKYAAAIPEKVVLAEHWREAEAAPRSLGAAIVESSFAT